MKHLEKYILVALISVLAVGCDDYRKFEGLPSLTNYVREISVAPSSVKLNVEDTLSLSVKMYPQDVSDKIEWTSSNDSVAVVENGKLKALSAGVATISAKSVKNPSAKSESNIFVKERDVMEYVDLGLSVNWATCNIGANKPEVYGDYFAWGETEPYYIVQNPLTWMNNKSGGYDWNTYKYCNGSETSMTKYCTVSGYGGVDGRSILETGDDAARSNWGGSWRMPTSAEWEELMNSNNCTWNWTTQNGVKGYRVTGKRSGYTSKSIFLPASGYRNGNNLYSPGTEGLYWSSTLGESRSDHAVNMTLRSDAYYKSNSSRYYGRSVRAVSPSAGYISVTGVSLDKPSLTLETGQHSPLGVTFLPSNATDKSVTWSSSNPSVATVDTYGNVTAKSAGKTVITVTTVFGNKTSTCTVTVKSKQIIVSSVSLNTSSLSLEVGGTTTLTATVSPSNATDKSVQWSSNNTSVATVDEQGNVTAKSAGTATITATSSDGKKTATCIVTVKSQQSSDGSENGHDYVDLGLPSGIKWATCNVGANNPEEYGSYFAWGETTSKSTYNWSTYKYCVSSLTMTKYGISSSYGTVDNKTTLELSDDAARANWGGSWRMPTSQEIDELLNNCTWTWTTQNGINGYKVTSKKSGYTGKSIFLPAAGYRSNGSLDNAGSSSSVWSSSLSTDYSNNAYVLYFSSDNHDRSNDGRCYGLSIRPVCPSEGYVSVTGVSLNISSLSLKVGGTSTLMATVSPSNATDKSVTWRSSNTSVATVGSNGKVTAKSAGTATITVTATDGKKTASCTITVKSTQSSEGKENGHEYVDLGLSVKWATCNVGASKPEDYGSYFAWGETNTKSTYSWSTYKYCNGNYESMTKYCTDNYYGTVDNKTTLELIDDAARANWGGKWRMPTASEIDELRNNCTWTWTTQNGINGYKVTSIKSGYTGKSIFLPAAGGRDGDYLYYAGSFGIYWSSSLRTSYGYNAYVLYFDSDSHSRDSSRYYGQSVRPVCP